MAHKQKGETGDCNKKEEQIEGAEERSYTFIQTMYIRRPRHSTTRECEQLDWIQNRMDGSGHLRDDLVQKEPWPVVLDLVHVGNLGCRPGAPHRSESNQ